MLSAVLGLLASGCGSESEIKDAIRQSLKDPDSAKFQELVTNKAGDRACASFNAKNSMGGYGDWQIAELRKINSKWTVQTFNGDASNCNEASWRNADINGR